MHSSHSMKGALSYMYRGEPGSKLDETGETQEEKRSKEKERFEAQKTQFKCAVPGCKAVPKFNDGRIIGFVQIQVRQNGAPVSTWLCEEHDKEMLKDKETVLRRLPEAVWMPSAEFFRKYR